LSTQAPASATRQHPLRSLLSERAFCCFVAARFLASLGFQIQTVAVGLDVYAVRHNPMDLGWVGLSQFIPFLLLVLPAGQLADRVNRRRIFLVCLVLQTCCAAAFLYWTRGQAQSVVWVFLIMSIFGASRAILMPTTQALLPNVIPADLLGNAVALNSSLWQIATITGPALGGLLYATLGHSVVYALNMTLFLAALLAVWLMRSPQQSKPTQQRRFQDVIEGIRFVRQRPVLLGALSLDLFAVLFGGATALMPAIATDFLHVGATGLGWLRAAPGIGAASVAMLLMIKPITQRVGRSLFIAIGCFGLATIVLGVSTSLSVSLLALTALGAADMLSVYIRNMLVQLETPDQMRGRIGAVNALFIGASNELGEFESGLTAAWWGVKAAIIIGGIMTLVVGVIWTYWFKPLRHLQQFPAAH
jgi:MFS family permease